MGQIKASRWSPSTEVLKPEITNILPHFEAKKLQNKLGKM